MLAGLEDRVILAPQQLGLQGIPDFASITDLRVLVQQQNWDTSEESKTRIYKWVYDNLWHRLEHRIIGFISPGPPTSQDNGFGRFNPLGLAQRDFFVALRLAALWLDPRDADQAELLDKFFEDAPSPIPVTGVSPDEGSTVDFIAKHGNWNMAISYPNAPLSAGNLTVFSGVRPDPIPYQPQISQERILSTLSDRPVAMLWNSDGDNLHYQMDRGFHGSVDWVWEKVQGSSFGWTINPTLADLAPLIWNYYVDSRDKVELVSGFSGAGFTAPRMMSNSQLEAYLMRASTYLNLTGIRTIRVNNSPPEGPWNESIAALYNEGLRNTELLGVVYDAILTRWGLHFSYEGSPVPVAQTAYVLEPSTLESSINHILSRKADSVLVNLASGYGWHAGEVIQDTDAVGAEAVLFSNASTDFVEIIQGPFINMAPGDYKAVLRLKVADNQSTVDFVEISVSRANRAGLSNQIIGFTEFTRHKIAPADFEEPNTYKLIKVPFKLDSFTTGLEIIVSHRGDETDLTADYIQFTKTIPDGMPVFAPLFIVVTSAERQTDTPRQFTEQFENGGGIVLSPDEFVAALNPEYMINLATSILGAGHPGIADANQLLVDGKYYSSLVTVRNALQQVTSVATQKELPWEFELSQNYPNPFNPSTTIEFDLPKTSKVTLKIFNILGEEVATLVSDRLSAGSYSYEWDASNLASGVYLYRLEAGDFVQTKKMILLR
ncbi:MAG: T9SS type A sorting domain-containing protein, partial [Planctomycetota bacterium]|jgi:hypothetical protein